MIIKYKEILFFYSFLFSLNIFGMQETSNNDKQKKLADAEKLKALIEKQEERDEFIMSATVSTDSKNITKNIYDIDGLGNIKVSWREKDALDEIESAIINLFFNTLVKKEDQAAMEILVEYLQDPFVNNSDKIKKRIFLFGETSTAYRSKKEFIKFRMSFLQDFFEIAQHLEKLNQEEKNNFIMRARGFFEKARNKFINIINRKNESSLLLTRSQYYDNVDFSRIMYKALNYILRRRHTEFLKKCLFERKESEKIEKEYFTFMNFYKVFQKEDLNK